MSKTLPLILTAFLLGGCVRTLHPLADPEHTVFEPAVLGTWTQNDKDYWTFSRADGETDAYRLEHRKSSGEVTVLRARLVRLGDAFFLETSLPESPDLEQRTTDWERAHLTPSYVISYVEELGPPARLRYPDNKGLQRYLEEHPQATPYTAIDDVVVLTGPTEQLQAFLADPERREAVFSDQVNEMRRVEAPDQQPAD